MTKAQKAERQRAIDALREILKPGDTVYTVLEHVSRSGMMRAIRVVVPVVDPQTGKSDFLHPNYNIGLALGLRHWTRNGRSQDALIMHGCGMDMGFSLVYHLSQTLHGAGYACLGSRSACPSNYHVNHRDRIRCNGIVRADGSRRHCYAPSYGYRFPVAADWPTGSAIDIGDGQTIPGSLLYCVETPEDDPDGQYVVCPSCNGAGYHPNPDGPERFDLVHTDGYALRHRWL